MANKNTNGSVFMRFKNREARLVNKLDKRSENGKDNEDDVSHSYTTNNDERVWSF